MAIFLTSSTSGITSGEKVCRELKMAAILRFRNIKHSFNLTSDMQRSSQIMPKKVFFMMMTSSMTSQGGLEFGPIYSFINEIATLMTSPDHKVGQILKIDISPSIFELERRSKAQNVANAHGYLFDNSTSGITSGEKVCRELKMAAILKILIY